MNVPTPTLMPSFRGKGPGETVVDKTEFEASDTRVECSKTFQTHGECAGEMEVSWSKAELTRPGRCRTIRNHHRSGRQRDLPLSPRIVH